jgi:hypothetical protein
LFGIATRSLMRTLASATPPVPEYRFALLLVAALPALVVACAAWD